MSATSEFQPATAGKITAVVTYLEVNAPPLAGMTSAPHGCTLRRAEALASDWYLDMHRRIGEDWLWSSRVRTEDAELRAILEDPLVEVYALQAGGSDEGLLELDFREKEACKLAYFGVTPALVGAGAARWLLGRAIDMAWSRLIARFWTQTCTLDHPNALPFYLRAGFTAYKREIEITDDPPDRRA
jgi:GNAT superfamily N-acetyltransferase